jgi:predicted permease
MSLWSRLRKTLLPGRHQEEIDEELAFHLEMRRSVEGDARRARLRFGSPDAIREDVRDAGILVWLDGLMRDVSMAFRQLRASWIVTVAVVLTLALGIGANTAIFGLVDAAILKPLPVTEPATLHLVSWKASGWPDPLCDSHRGNTDGNPLSDMTGSSSSPLLYREMAKQQRAGVALIGFSDSSNVTLTIDRRGGEEVGLQYVSVNYFHELGLVPAAGRPILEADDRVGAPLAVVISHRLWQRQFGGRREAVGTTVRVNGTMATIAGIAPAGFFGLAIGEWVDLYAPLAAEVMLTRGADSTQPLAERANFWWVRQMIRLPKGAAPESVAPALTSLYQRLVVPDGVTIAPQQIPTLTLAPGAYGFDHISDDDARALWVLWLLVGLVLLIVCANVANLLLARAVGRHREAAIRVALGAARSRLFRQHLLESVVLAGVGGTIGLAGGLALARLLDALLQRSPLDHFAIGLDWRIALFAASLSVGAALLFGLAPALRMARADVHDALKAHGRSITSGHLRLPRLLVTLQVGLCLAVLVAAGLLGRSLTTLRLSDIGFEREQIVYVTVNPWRAGLRADDVAAYVDRMRAAFAATPGVVRVATIGSRPLSGSSSQTQANFPGRPSPQDGSNRVLLNEFGDGVVETLGLRVIDGRAFQASDMTAASDAVLVDRRFAERYFDGRPAIGQRFGTRRDDDNAYQIVGVLENSRYHSLRHDPEPTMYRPMRAAVRRNRDVHFAIRTGMDSRALGPALRAAALGVNPDVPVTALHTQTSLIDRMIRTERLLSLASWSFGGIALLLAAIGLGGLLAYAVSRRTPEIGVRMAMGAAPGQVAGMVMRDSLKLVGMGILLGVPGAYWVGGLLKSIVVGVDVHDPGTLAVALAVLAMVAGVAAWGAAPPGGAQPPLYTVWREWRRGCRPGGRQPSTL